MNGRFLILVAAILGFMHLWSHAVPVRGQRLAKATMPSFATSPVQSAQKSANQRPPVHQPVAASRTVAAVRHSQPLRHVPIAQTNSGLFDLSSQTSPFQIPGGLAAGNYRVVSSGGFVGTIHVAGSAEKTGPAIDCSLVQTRQAGETVCFVRLTEAAASTVALSVPVTDAVTEVKNGPGLALINTASETAAVHVDWAVRVLPSAAETIEPAPHAADAASTSAAAHMATSPAATTPAGATPVAAAELGTGAAIGVCTPVTPKPVEEPVVKSAGLDFDKFDGWPVTVPFADSFVNQANQSRDAEPTNTDAAQTTDTVNSDFELEETKWCTAGADIDAAN